VAETFRPGTAAKAHRVAIGVDSDQRQDWLSKQQHWHDKNCQEIKDVLAHNRPFKPRKARKTRNDFVPVRAFCIICPENLVLWCLYKALSLWGFSPQAKAWG
jgi:hypothetical protein